MKNPTRPVLTIQTYPPTSELKTGDLLFPKKPEHRVLEAKGLLGNNRLTVSKNECNLERQQGADTALPTLLDLQKLPPQKLLETNSEQWRDMVAYAHMVQSRIRRAFGLRFADRLLQLVLPNFFELVRLLFNETAAITSPLKPDLSLTFSHVAMAFEEDGEWYVIESGATDFSHYRVSVSPYFDADDHNRAPSQYRGWAMRRQSLGQHVWSARSTPVLNQAQQQQLVNECKAHLGIPYGILEPGMINNDDRIYCSELVAYAYASLDPPLPITHNQNWFWIASQLLGLNKTMVKTFCSVMGTKGYPFPLLSPAMIYTSPCMQPVFSPGEQNFLG